MHAAWRCTVHTNEVSPVFWQEGKKKKKGKSCAEKKNRTTSRSRQSPSQQPRGRGTQARPDTKGRRRAGASPCHIAAVFRARTLLVCTAPCCTAPCCTYRAVLRACLGVPGVRVPGVSQATRAGHCDQHRLTILLLAPVYLGNGEACLYLAATQLVTDLAALVHLSEYYHPSSHTNPDPCLCADLQSCSPSSPLAPARATDRLRRLSLCHQGRPSRLSIGAKEAKRSVHRDKRGKEVCSGGTKWDRGQRGPGKPTRVASAPFASSSSFDSRQHEIWTQVSGLDAPQGSPKMALLRRDSAKSSAQPGPRVGGLLHQLQGPQETRQSRVAKGNQWRGR